MNKDLSYIDDADGLDQVCRQLQAAEWLAVDTEFERVRTYFPELCLLQVASRDLTVVIDPLRITDLSPLFAVLYDTAIIKVFHAARQDLELFYILNGHVPVPLFDTQLAAPLLGYDAFISYARLVQAMLNVALPKSHTRTNWKRRPLNSGQLRYAADDVIYLGEIFQRMQDKLGAADKTRLETEFTALVDPVQYLPDPETMWRRIRDARRFGGERLSVLQRLASWREKTAREENRPRKWVLADAALLDMARLLPEEAADLEKIKGMDEVTITRYGGILLDLIARARQMAPLN